MRVPVQGSEDKAADAEQPKPADRQQDPPLGQLPQDAEDEQLPPENDQAEDEQLPADDDQAEDDTVAPEDEIVSICARILAESGAYSVLHPGCGTGRHARYLAAAGFLVTAFDLAALSVRLVAARSAPEELSIRYLVADPSLPAPDIGQFDGLFAPNILHLFQYRQRRRILHLLTRNIRSGGVGVVTVVSNRDERYAQGREVERDTFEVFPGQAMHFYSEDELYYELDRHFRVAVIEDVIEVETDHLGIRREYAMLLACGIKRE